MLRVYIDPDRAIVREWEDMAGKEAVGVLVIKWAESQALVQVPKVGRCKAYTTRMLKRYGFKDTIDKLHIRVALAFPGRNIVSADP